MSLCSFSDDTLLNYSCHDKQSTKATEAELNAIEVTELLCGNYSKSQEEDCKRVSLIFLDLQMDGLCIASSSVTLLQPTVTLQLYESHKPYFAVCVKPHDQLESQYQYEHAFDCTSNQTRELTLNITEFNSINNNNTNYNSWHDPWITIVQINIVACETPSIPSNYTNLETTEKDNRLLRMLLIISGIGIIIIILLLLTIAAACRKLNSLNKKKLFKGLEREDNKILRTTTLKLQEEDITSHAPGFQRDSITTACSDPVTYNINQLSPFATSSLPEITYTVHGSNLQEIYNVSLPISTCSDPQKVDTFSIPSSPTNTILAAFFHQQPDRTASISSTDTMSGTGPKQMFPITSISPTDTISTGSDPEQACPTASISPTGTTSTGSGPEQTCPTASISDTILTGSGPKQRCSTTSISPTDTISTSSGHEQAHPTTSISPTDTISTCSGPQQACTTPSISSTGSGTEQAYPIIVSNSSTDTISTGTGPEQACPTATISITDTILIGSHPEQMCPTASNRHHFNRL